MGGTSPRRNHYGEGNEVGTEDPFRSEPELSREPLSSAGELYAPASSSIEPPSALEFENPAETSGIAPSGSDGSPSSSHLQDFATPSPKPAENQPSTDGEPKLDSPEAPSSTPKTQLSASPKTPEKRPADNAPQHRKPPATPASHTSATLEETKLVSPAAPRASTPLAPSPIMLPASAPEDALAPSLPSLALPSSPPLGGYPKKALFPAAATAINPVPAVTDMQSPRNTLSALEVASIAAMIENAVGSIAAEVSPSRSSLAPPVNPFIDGAQAPEVLPVRHNLLLTDGDEAPPESVDTDSAASDLKETAESPASNVSTRREGGVEQERDVADSGLMTDTSSRLEETGAEELEAKGADSDADGKTLGWQEEAMNTGGDEEDGSQASEEPGSDSLVSSVSNDGNSAKSTADVSDNESPSAASNSTPSEPGLHASNTSANGEEHKGALQGAAKQEVAQPSNHSDTKIQPLPVAQPHFEGPSGEKDVASNVPLPQLKQSAKNKGEGASETQGASSPLQPSVPTQIKSNVASPSAGSKPAEERGKGNQGTPSVSKAASSRKKPEADHKKKDTDATPTTPSRQQAPSPAQSSPQHAPSAPAKHTKVSSSPLRPPAANNNVPPVAERDSRPPPLPLIAPPDMDNSSVTSISQASTNSTEAHSPSNSAASASTTSETSGTSTKSREESQRRSSHGSPPPTPPLSPNSASQTITQFFKDTFSHLKRSVRPLAGIACDFEAKPGGEAVTPRTASAFVHDAGSSLSSDSPNHSQVSTPSLVNGPLTGTITSGMGRVPVKEVTGAVPVRRKKKLLQPSSEPPQPVKARQTRLSKPLRKQPSKKHTAKEHPPPIIFPIAAKHATAANDLFSTPRDPPPPVPAEFNKQQLFTKPRRYPKLSKSRTRSPIRPEISKGKVPQLKNEEVSLEPQWSVSEEVDESFFPHRPSVIRRKSPRASAQLPPVQRKRTQRMTQSAGPQRSFANPPHDFKPQRLGSAPLKGTSEAPVPQQQQQPPRWAHALRSRSPISSTAASEALTSSSSFSRLHPSGARSKQQPMTELPPLPQASKPRQSSAPSPFL